MAIKKFGNATLEDIKSFEQRYMLKLPDDYAAFLSEYNGGRVKLDSDGEIFVRYIKDIINVDVLFGLNTYSEQLDLEWRMEKYKDDLLKNIVIIGDTYQHGFIILSCNSAQSGVYYWDHTYELECSNDKNNTFYLTDTFTDFIKRIIKY